MSVYTTVTREQLAEWLRRYAVGALQDLQGIAAGIENTNYFVTTTQGRFVLTLFEKLTARDLPFYLGLMAHLADRGIPCANPVASLSGKTLGELNGRPAALVRFLPGSDVALPGVGHCAAVGAVLAEMHLAGLGYGAPMENPRGPRWWRATAREVMEFLPAQDQALLTEELRFQALYRLQDLPRGVIHADLFTDNVLFEDTRVTGIIDFYFACKDVLLYDLAIAANDWCFERGRGFDEARLGAMMRSYHGVRPLNAIERGAWPVLLRAGALRFWVSRLHDYHCPRPGEITHAKDPDEFRDILKFHASGHAQLARLWV